MEATCVGPLNLEPRSSDENEFWDGTTFFKIAGDDHVRTLSSDRSTQGLLATDYVILNHGQVTWTTLELASPSPNYHSTPMRGRLSLDRSNVHRSPTRLVFSGTGLELVTRPTTIRYLDHSATAAIGLWRG
ncbi:uncharacterized protein TNCV_2587571 [Trichonephila clavipes]|nr:uncharacterized protein TNCV_2587571 [Trichonephila clavipes]